MYLEKIRNFNYRTSINYIKLSLSRGLGMLSIYSLNYVLAKQLSLYEAGTIFVVLSYNIFVVTFLIFGGNFFLLKYVPRLFELDHKEIIFNLILSIIFVCSLMFTVSIFMLGSYNYITNQEFLLSNHTQTNTLLLTFFISIVNAVILLIAEVFKSIKKFELSLFLTSTSFNILTTILIYVRNVNSFSEAYELLFYSLAICLVLSIWLFYHYIGFYPLRLFSPVTIVKKSFFLYMSGLSVMFLHIFDIISVDFFMDKEAAGVYNVAKKIGLLAFFPAQTLANIYSQQISTLSFTNKEQLRDYIRRSTKHILIISVLFLGLLLFVSPLLLDFFGRNYSSALKPMYILLVGYTLHGFSQPYAYYLILKGKYVYICVIQIAIFFASINYWLYLFEQIELEGLAVIYAITLLSGSIACRYYFYKLLNITKYVKETQK